jgi:hypothetical protein
MINYRIAKNKWSKAKPLVKVINEKCDRFPMISPNREYLFFTRYDRKGNEDIYWVDAKIVKKDKP